MDDLAGLDLSKDTNATKPQNASYNYNTSAFSALKPTPPTSGRVTPLNSTSQPASKPATPANDSFSNLVSFSSSSSNANLSLQEHQKRIAALKLEQQKKTAQAQHQQYSGGDDFWNNLGSGRSTPAPGVQGHVGQSPKPAVEEEDDMFAVFNAPVAKPQKPAESSGTKLTDDDDDPFELSKVKPPRADTEGSSTNGFDDDDVLGLLGKPVSARRQAEPVNRPSSTVAQDTNPQDRAVAELVDMGFPVDKARQALDSTASGADVQAAVGHLLNQAHQEARDRSQSSDPDRNGHSPVASSRRGGGRIDSDRQRRQEQQIQDSGADRRRQQVSGEKDPSQVAQEFGANFLKSANTLWKQGQKRMQQAVQEFNSDSDSNQPKWMQQPDRMAKAEVRSQQRGNEAGIARRRRRSSQTQAQKQQSGTDEAMMLEAVRPTPPPRPPRSRAEAQLDSSADNSRDHSPAVPSRLRETHSPQPAFLRHPQPQKPVAEPSAPTSRAALSRQAIDDQAAQAYVSSARRRKPAVPAPAAASEQNLLEGSARQPPPPRPASSRPTPSAASSKQAPIAVRPSAPPRSIPPISAMSLKASHSHREKGNEHYKRGDYSSARQAYTTAMSHLPATHPITVILLTNRALTALKIGEPKTAITDSDAAMTIIGVSKGDAENIDLVNGEPPKPMRDYYGKALMRKAEALEQMEKWPEAAAVWREAVEGGHGGATSMQGRFRAEKAANPQLNKPKPRPPVAKKPPPRRSALNDLGGQDSKAVTALRAANVAAERADDEKFALYDSVDLRIKMWRDGKQDNLRALLGSLDTVLWEGSGWRKIGMADLVLPGKVKVQYMKGIGKVHPDKVLHTL